MLYVLIDHYFDFLDAHGFSFLRVMRYVEFRAVAAIIVSFLLVMVLAPRTIRWLVRLKIGDHPEFYNAKLNELTKAKSNTPTMGGVLISGSILITTLLLGELRPQDGFYVLMALICLVWLAALGAVDDWLKLTASKRKPGSREGLYFWEKLVFQLGLAVILGIFIHHHGSTKLDPRYEHFNEMSHALNLPFMKTWQYVNGAWVPADHLIVLGTATFVILSIIVIAGASNAVNLTDGMDGLASGIMSIVAFAFMILALIAGVETRAKFLLVPYIPLADELAVVAGAMVGSCLAFLWYNANPAQVFMGDTGSLPLGGLIGYIAVVTRQEFLLLIIGGVFVAEALSVILQVSYFKATGGKRIFKCAPIHHHFHLMGWTENQVVVRFWIISIILAACALATIKLR